MIEIHLDGKPVSKLEAARSVARPDGHSVDIGEPSARGWIEDGIAVYHRNRTLGGIEPAQVRWASYTGVSAADARMFAEAITIGAEIAELAEMLAAEQDAAPAAEPAEHDETADPDRQKTVRRAIALWDSATKCPLVRRPSGRW